MQTDKRKSPEVKGIISRLNQQAWKARIVWFTEEIFDKLSWKLSVCCPLKLDFFFSMWNIPSTHIYTHTPTQHFHVALPQRVNGSPSRMCLLQSLHKWRRNKPRCLHLDPFFPLCFLLFICMLVKLSVLRALCRDDESLMVDWLICSLWFWDRLLDHFHSVNALLFFIWQITVQVSYPYTSFDVICELFSRMETQWKLTSPFGNTYLLLLLSCRKVICTAGNSNYLKIHFSVMYNVTIGLQLLLLLKTNLEI